MLRYMYLMLQMVSQLGICASSNTTFDSIAYEIIENKPGSFPLKSLQPDTKLYSNYSIIVITSGRYNIFSWSSFLS